MHPPEISELYIQAQGHLRTLLLLLTGLILLFPFAAGILVSLAKTRRVQWTVGFIAGAIIALLGVWLFMDSTNTQAVRDSESLKYEKAVTTYYKDTYAVTFDDYYDLQRLRAGETVNAKLDGKPALVSLSGPYDHQKLIASDASQVHEIKPRR